LKSWIKATDWRKLTSADAAPVELKINWNLATDSQKKDEGRQPSEAYYGSYMVSMIHNCKSFFNFRAKVKPLRHEGTKKEYCEIIFE